MQEQVIILRIDKQTKEVDEITLEKACDKLEGYWDKEYIKPALIQGDILYNPYAIYTRKPVNN